jgi:predicted NAD/FAD-dependent oxidoreductase
MSALGRALGEDVERRQPCRIAEIVRTGEGWRLVDEGGAEQGLFDAVVVATPAPQAVPLLRDAPDLAEAASRAVLAPCWAGLFAFDRPLPLPDLRRPARGPLAWLARDRSKPGRGGAESWVVHANPDWSREHLEDDAATAVEALFEAFAGSVDVDQPAPTYARAHRWRYARVETAVGADCLFERSGLIAACGDWCLGPRVEAAFLSGAAAAGRLLNACVERERASSGI